jgi:cyclic beta-1,2-glucan synthetase
MILLSVANLLADSAIQERFHREPMVAATERLLHERVPGIIAVDRVGQPEPEVLIASPEAAYTNQASAAQAG